MTKKHREVEDAEVVTTTEAPEVAPRNDSPNPPTEVVPEEGAPPYPPEEPIAPIEAAPVWEGGDPGTAVESPNDVDGIYHPEPEPPADPDTDSDGTPDSLDDDDDGDGILDVDEV